MNVSKFCYKKREVSTFHVNYWILGSLYRSREFRDHFSPLILVQWLWMLSLLQWSWLFL